MTGSSLAPIMIPIVVMIALTGWLAMVYYANAHPGWKAHSAALKPVDTGAMVRTDGRKQIMRLDVKAVARRDQDMAEPGVHAGSGRVPSPPPRRAA
jgi:hypothetical protein